MEIGGSDAGYVLLCRYMGWEMLGDCGRLTSSLESFFFFRLFLAVWGLCCCMGFSLVVASWCYSLAVVCRLLIAVASLCGAWVLGAQTSVVVGPRL